MSPLLSGVIHRLDLRGRTGPAALDSVVRLLDDPPSGLGGLLVVDSADALVPHEQAFERISASEQVPAVVIVAIGPLDPDRVLRYPWGVRIGDGLALLWVGDPVGVTWRPGAPSAVRRTKPAPEQAVTRLLRVLETPAVHQAVCALPSGGVTAPGLTLLAETDDDEGLAAALIRALERLTADAGSVPALEQLDEAAHAVRLAIEAPASGSTLVAGGPLSGRGEGVRLQVGDALELRHRLARPSGLLGGSEAVDRLAATSAQLGAELGAYRSDVRQLREGVQSPGGGINPAEVAQRCRDYGLRLPQPQPGQLIDLPRRLGELVFGWLRQDTGLGQATARLQAMEDELRPGSRRDHEQRVAAACPDQLLAALGAPPAFPPPPPYLFVIGLVLGFLCALSGSFGPETGALAALGWAAALGLWPAARTRDRVRAGAGGLVGAGVGAALGAVAGRQLAIPAWAAVAILIVAGWVAVIGLTRTWAVVAGGWVRTIPLEQVSMAEAGLTAVVESLVRSEWSVADSRQAMTNLLIMARSMVAGSDAALRSLLAALRTHRPAGHVPPAAQEFWDAMVDGRSRSLLLAAMTPAWEGVGASVGAGGAGGPAPQQLESSVRAETTRRFETWMQAGADPGAGPLGPEPSRLDSAPLSEGALEYLAAAVGTDPVDAMWQLVGPNDAGVLSPRPDDVTYVRFAPVSLPDDILRGTGAEVVLTEGSGLAGVLRLVPMRAGTTRQAWADPAAAAGGEHG